MPVSAPRVMIAEDSVLLREGLTRILTSADQEVVGAYDNADELLVRLRTQPCDVVIMDIRLPPTHTDEGMRAALQIRRSRPDVAVLVLSQYVELGLALQLLSDSAEGVGYLLKDRISDVPTFVESVRRVAAGDTGVGPALGHQAEDLPFSWGETSQRRVVRLALDEPAHDRRVDHAFA